MPLRSFPLNPRRARLTLIRLHQSASPSFLPRKTTESESLIQHNLPYHPPLSLPSHHNSLSRSIPHATHHLAAQPLLIRTQALQSPVRTSEPLKDPCIDHPHGFVSSPKSSLIPVLDKQGVDGWGSSRVLSWRIFSCPGGSSSTASDSRTY
ncbi:hypothetical protein CVT26_009331 [Gymnopilus dilepis]|uniref:Uncharacterized protein n=1 Tax=Gymnopilus dilepis TaxID=231916 RepID=A0A409YA51_9AGAR|nr:hypothetical protein CVT26_009331 [Gymnopilus dilepis]